MSNRLSDWINSVSSTRIALVCLAIFLLFSVLVLPDQASKTGGYSGEVGSPDLSFFYTAEELYEFADAYGLEGRAAYIRARFTFDVVWPLVYVIFLVTAISWVFKRASIQGKLWQRLNLVPLLGMLFDFLENISASIVMARYPNTTALIDHLAGIFTMVKWVFVGGSFVVLLCGVVLAVGRYIHQRK